MSPDKMQPTQLTPEQDAPPHPRRRQHTELSPQSHAVVVFGFLTAAVLTVAMLVAFTAVHFILAAVALAGAWAALAPAAALVGGQFIGNGHGRQGR